MHAAAVALPTFGMICQHEHEATPRLGSYKMQRDWRALTLVSAEKADLRQHHEAGP